MIGQHLLPQVDRQVRHLGLRVLKTPPQSPQANAICERLIGTLRRNAGFSDPLTEPHLRCLLHEWVPHDNEGRPHLSLGQVSRSRLHICLLRCKHIRHQLPEHLRVVVCPILGGLHHDTSLDSKPHDRSADAVRKRVTTRS